MSRFDSPNKPIVCPQGFSRGDVRETVLVTHYDSILSLPGTAPSTSSDAGCFPHQQAVSPRPPTIRPFPCVRSVTAATSRPWALPSFPLSRDYAASQVPYFTPTHYNHPLYHPLPTGNRHVFEVADQPIPIVYACVHMWRRLCAGLGRIFEEDLECLFLQAVRGGITPCAYFRFTNCADCPPPKKKQKNSA